MSNPRRRGSRADPLVPGAGDVGPVAALLPGPGRSLSLLAAEAGRPAWRRLVGDGEAVVEGGHVGADDEPGDVVAAQETLPSRAPGDSKPPASTPAQRPFGPARHRSPCERGHWRPAGLSQRPAPRHPGAVCLRRAVERSFVPCRRLSSSPGLPCWEPHAPGTGSDLRVTMLAVLEPRQIPRLPKLGLRT